MHEKFSTQTREPVAGGSLMLVKPGPTWFLRFRCYCDYLSIYEPQSVTNMSQEQAKNTDFHPLSMLF